MIYTYSHLHITDFTSDLRDISRTDLKELLYQQTMESTGATGQGEKVVLTVLFDCIF